MTHAGFILFALAALLALALGPWAIHIGPEYWQRWRERGNSSVPIQILVADGTRRRSIEHALRRGLRQLQAALGPSFPGAASAVSSGGLVGLAVVVQQIIRTDHQVAGCCHLLAEGDGARRALVRLALQVGGRVLTADEVLAALTEQCVGLASLPDAAPGTVVAVDLELPAAEPDARRRQPTISTAAATPGAAISVATAASTGEAAMMLPPDPLAPLPFPAAGPAAGTQATHNGHAA